MAAVNEDPETKNLKIKYEDESGKLCQEEFDLVILSVGLVAPADIKELSQKLGIELNERQRNALRYSFREGFITNKIYREINKVSHELANRELSQLVELDLLRVKGRGRATKYVPKS